MDRVTVHMLDNSWGVDYDESGNALPKSFYYKDKNYFVSKKLAEHFDDKMVAVELNKKLPVSTIENKKLDKPKKKKRGRRKKKQELEHASI